MRAITKTMWGPAKIDFPFLFGTSSYSAYGPRVIGALSPKQLPIRPAKGVEQDDQEWDFCCIERGSRASIYTLRNRRQLRLIYDVFG